MVCCLKGAPKEPGPPEGILYKVMKLVYSPFLLSAAIRPAVVVAFLAWLCSSVAVIPKIPVGLEQELSMPEDSYVLKYFEYMGKFLSVGPPVYFVVSGRMNFASYSQQNKLCGTVNCDPDSLLTQLYMASRQSN